MAERLKQRGRWAKGNSEEGALWPALAEPWLAGDRCYYRLKRKRTANSQRLAD